MHCPVDQHALQRTSESALQCPACSGFWFSAADMRAMAGRLPKHGNQLAAAGMPVTTATRAGRQCPSCSESLLAFLVANIEVDVCRRCRGLWLDGGELGPVIRWHANRRVAKSTAKAQPAAKRKRSSNYHLDPTGGVDLVDLGRGGLWAARRVEAGADLVLEGAGAGANAVLEFVGYVSTDLLLETLGSLLEGI